MSNARGKSIDTTYLSLDKAEQRGFIHRDYVAHCMRYSHVIKRFYERQNYKTAKVLDIGAGRELPFCKTLYSSRLIPEAYCAVDVGPFNQEAVDIVKGGKLSDRADLFPHKDLIDIPSTFFAEGWFTHTICFEVLEHVEPGHAKQMLNRMALWTKRETGRIFISTPCYNWKDCAANHVNEMTYMALGAMIESLGLKIENVHGTFASIRDYVGEMNEAYQEVFQDLRDYYDTNFLSVVFAPMFPGHSRNALWELSVPKDWGIVEPEPDQFPPIYECKTPWGSSTLWPEMAPDPDNALKIVDAINAQREREAKDPTGLIEKTKERMANNG